MSAGGAPEPLALEERAVVVSTEETGLLTLRPPRGSEPGRGRLGAGLLLRLLAQRESDATEERRIDRREHVRLILAIVDRARDETHPAALHDLRIVTRPELVGADTCCECHELVESKRAVAAHARVRCLTGFVGAHERIDDRTLELGAKVERDVRQPERVARRTRRSDSSGRAACPLGVGCGGILPEAQGRADGVATRSPERDRTVDAAAHRNDDAARTWLRPEHLPERRGKRVDGERLATDRSGFEQRQPDERAVEPRGVRRDDSVALDAEPHCTPRSAVCRVSEDLGAHDARLAPEEMLHPADEATAVANLASQVGAVRSVGKRLAPTPAPFTCLLVHVWTGATHRVEPGDPTGCAHGRR